MKFRRFAQTTQFKRFLLALLTVAGVNVLLLLVSLFGGAPSFSQIATIDSWIVLILVVRFGWAFFWRLRCPSCRKAYGGDTGKISEGYPLMRCPKCGSEWLL